MRIGDLVFCRKDGSLWGVTHNDGLSSIVRLEAPFKSPRVLDTLPFATDFFNLDLSPDGTQLTGALTDESGTQRLGSNGTRLTCWRALRRTKSVRLPVRFTGQLYLFSGWPVSFRIILPERLRSNLFRLDLKTKKLDALSNSETGLFRPLPLPDGNLAAFEYSAQGFPPCEPAGSGDRRCKRDPIPGTICRGKISGVEDLGSCSRATILTISSFVLTPVSTNPFAAWSFSRYIRSRRATRTRRPGGVRLDLGDGLGLSHIESTLSYSPDESAGGEGSHSISAGGRPTGIGRSPHTLTEPIFTRSVRGLRKWGDADLSWLAEKKKNFIYDSDRTLDLTMSLAGYSGLDKLPDYQNVATSHTQIVSGTVSSAISHWKNRWARSKVKAECQWKVSAEVDDTFPKVFPRVWEEYARGFLLPLRNSSLWIRFSLVQGV